MRLLVTPSGRTYAFSLEGDETTITTTASTLWTTLADRTFSRLARNSRVAAGPLLAFGAKNGQPLLSFTTKRAGCSLKNGTKFS